MEKGRPRRERLHPGSAPRGSSGRSEMHSGKVKCVLFPMQAFRVGRVTIGMVYKSHVNDC